MPGSSFRSENNFGTSAVVPGDPGGGDGSGGAGGGDGGGSGASGDGTASGFDPASSSLDTGDTSTAQSYLLLALIAAGGILLGVTSARTREAD